MASGAVVWHAQRPKAKYEVFSKLGTLRCLRTGDGLVVTGWLLPANALWGHGQFRPDWRNQYATTFFNELHSHA
jgi:hypothetical protein